MRIAFDHILVARILFTLMTGLSHLKICELG
jgi:hypothetical protein